MLTGYFPEMHLQNLVMNEIVTLEIIYMILSKILMNCGSERGEENKLLNFIMCNNAY